VWGFDNISYSNQWVGEYANNYNNTYVHSSASGNVVSEYFPMDKAYNWPNPVYGDETKIRFYVSESSNAEIKIFDLAGDLVAELNGSAVGGMDNEITWNVNNIQSGVYLAHLTVNSVGGKSDSKLIKIAVIK
ncbi:MAG TPA: T9SS type A sorting domain-containing protein, partial [Ignavibacteria bacterium]|nr:T9SS type A sorting domain-containing protein [Ignavibacteria bacterium]